MGKERKFTLGLDIHGVLDKHPRKFIQMSNIIRAGGGRVVVCTGASVEVATKQLKDLNKLHNPNYFPVLGETSFWDEIFSITDYLKAKGVAHTPTDDGGIQVETEIWDRVKGDWAREYEIDLHIDDSPEYGRHFPDGVYLKFNDRASR
jgi:hypothetical protein